MRVGLVCPYSLDVPGGVQNHVRDLATVLADRGHDVGVLAPGEEDADLPAHVTTVGKAVAVPYNGSVARLAFGPRVAGRTRAWLRQGAWDVVHVHQPTMPSVSLIALWAAEAPVAATFHTAIPRSRAMSSAASLLRPSLEKISARIAVSESARETLVHHLGGEPLVLPNGISWARFRGAEPRPEWRRPGPVLAFLGRTDEPRKGLAVVLEALPAVMATHPDVRLLVAGRGHSGPDLVLPPLRDHVEFLGQIGDGDRSRLLASADVFVSPHTGGESFGIVLVEALAAGAPVVASDLDAFRAVLDDGRLGELFRTGDATDAGRVISALLSDPGRRSELRSLGPGAAARYDWARLVPDIEAVYETIRGARSTDGSAMQDPR